jgi:hypothetical protein
MIVEFNENELLLPVIEWLHLNVGSFEVNWRWVENERGLMNNFVEIDNEELATAFILTWG